MSAIPINLKNGICGLATLVVVYGWFITPLGWNFALFIWGYALVAFVITDFIKIGFYRLLDPGALNFIDDRVSR